MQIAELKVHIGQRVLIQGLNWQILPGQNWCVIGRNGAGKSSLLKILAGLRKPDSGQLSLQSHRFADWSLQELARKRSYLPQQRSDAFSYSVMETVVAARHPYFGEQYWETDADWEIAHTALREMDVLELAQRDVRSLSGGERQRVAIAALLAQDANWMLLDEPANALDLPHQIAVMNLLARLCREQNKAVVMVTHDINLAYRYATHALLLSGDGAWLAGPVQEVMTAEQLSACLGYPLVAHDCAGQTIFLPYQEAKYGSG
jgi:iron complex transport system ATP-binding protein